LLAQHGVTDDKEVELRAHEAAEGVLGSADDRLATNVEASVDYHRAACQPMEAADEVVIDRVGLAMYRLHPRRIVDVGYRRDAGALNIELIDSDQRLFLRRHVPHLLLGHRSD